MPSIQILVICRTVEKGPTLTPIFLVKGNSCRIILFYLIKLYQSLSPTSTSLPESPRLSPSHQIETVEADARAQEAAPPAPRHDADGQHLPLRGIRHPRADGHVVGQHGVVAAVGADREAAGAALGGRGRDGARPAVDADAGAPPDVGLGDADAQLVAGRDLLGAELEVDDVVVVDVDPHVAREDGGRRRAHDVVGRVPGRQPRVGRVHVRRLHGRVHEVEEAPGRAVPLADAPERRHVGRVGAGDGVDGGALARLDGDGARVHLELRLVDGEGVGAGQDARDAPGAVAAGRGPVLRVGVGQADDVGVALLHVGQADARDVAPARLRHPALDAQVVEPAPVGAAGEQVGARRLPVGEGEHRGALQAKTLRVRVAHAVVVDLVQVLAGGAAATHERAEERAARGLLVVAADHPHARVAIGLAHVVVCLVGTLCQYESRAVLCRGRRRHLQSIVRP